MVGSEWSEMVSVAVMHFSPVKVTRRYCLPACRCYITEDPRAAALKEQLNTLEAELAQVSEPAPLPPPLPAPLPACLIHWLPGVLLRATLATHCIY